MDFDRVTCWSTTWGTYKYVENVLEGDQEMLSCENSMGSLFIRFAEEGSPDKPVSFSCMTSCTKRRLKFRHFLGFGFGSLGRTNVQSVFVRTIFGIAGHNARIEHW